MHKSYVGVVNLELDLETVQKLILRAQQKLREAESHPHAAKQLEELRTRATSSGSLGMIDLSLVAAQLVRSPTSEDIIALRLIFETIAAIQVGLTASELNVAFSKRGMPYDTAIQEANVIISNINNPDGPKWLSRFLLSKLAPVALRTMAAYIEKHDAPKNWKDGWAAQKKRAPVLLVLADVSEVLAKAS